jgi:hypothetical protein
MPAVTEEPITPRRFIARHWKLALVATALELTVGLPERIFPERWWGAIWNEYARLVRSIEFKR